MEITLPLIVPSLTFFYLNQSNGQDFLCKRKNIFIKKILGLFFPLISAKKTNWQWNGIMRTFHFLDLNNVLSCFKIINIYCFCKLKNKDFLKEKQNKNP